MKRQTRNLILALSAVVLLVGLLILVMLLVDDDSKTNSGNSSGQSSGLSSDSILGATGTYLPINADVNKLLEVKIQNGNGEILINREGEIFSIKEYEGYPQSTGNYKTITEGLSAFGSNDMVENPESLEPYGLKNPAATVFLKYSDGKTYTVYVGDEAKYSQDEGRYAKVEGDNNVYVLKSGVADLALAKKTEFLSVTITNVAYENVADILKSASFSGKNFPSFTLSPAKRTYDGETYEDSLKLDFPYDIYIDDGNEGKANAVFSTLFNMFASEIEVLGYTDADLYKYGLINPTTTCTLNYGENSSITMKLGDKASDGAYYLITDQYKIIYKISDHYAETLYNMSPGSIMSTAPVLPPIYITDTVNITYGGKTYSYKIDCDISDMTYLKVVMDGKEVNNDAFRQFYSTALLYKVTEVTTLETVGQCEFKIEYIYEDKEKGSDTLEFYNNGERKYKVVKNKKAAFITGTSEVRNIMKAFDSLVKGEGSVESN